jgi:hypothetical protein
MRVVTQDETYLATGRAPTYARGEELHSTDPRRRGPTGDLDAHQYRSFPYTTSLVGSGSPPHTADMNEQIGTPQPDDEDAR